MTRLESRAGKCAHLLVIGALILCAPMPALAQGGSGHFEVHANEDVTASMIGLPEFPGARSYSDSSNDARANIGFEFGDVRFRLLLAKYITDASPSRVLDFYRKALSRYDDVLECDHGRPVGSVTKTRGGLTCADQRDGNGHVHTGDDLRELRAGTPERFRIVAIEAPRDGATKFILMLMEVPRREAGDDR